MLVQSSSRGFGRGKPPVGLPYRLPNEGELVSIHLNALSDVNPCPTNNCWYVGNDGINAPEVNWCGAIFAPHYGTAGAWAIRGGGHDGGEGTYAKLFDIGLGKWKIIGKIPPNSAWLNSLDPVWGDYLYEGSYLVPADHTYGNMVYISPSQGGGPQGSMLMMCSTYGGFEGYRPHAMDLATGDITRFTTGIYNPYMAYGSYGACFVDTNRNIAWGMTGIETNAHCYIDLNETPKVITADSSFYAPGYYFNACFVPEADRTICVFSKSDQANMLLGAYSLASGKPVAFNINQASQLPKLPNGGYGLVWHPTTKKFYVYEGGGATSLTTFTPPANFNEWATGPWTWGSETPTGQTFANVKEPMPGAQGHQSFTKLLLHPQTGCLMWTNGTSIRQSPDGVMRDGAFQLYRPIGA